MLAPATGVASGVDGASTHRRAGPISTPACARFTRGAFDRRYAAAAHGGDLSVDMEAVRRRHQDQAQKAFASMLRSVEWDVFATVEPKHPGTSHARVLELLAGQIGAAAQAAASDYPAWVGVTETGVAARCRHAHALLRYPKRVAERFEEDPLRLRAWRREQERRWSGNAVFREYEPGGGACAYLAKKFGREDTELRISRPARRALHGGYNLRT